jgi:hypothetical protein
MAPVAFPLRTCPRVAAHRTITLCAREQSSCSEIAMDHRIGSRIFVFETVLLRGPTGELTEAALTEMSLSGAWVRTPARWPPMCPLHVMFSRAAGAKGGTLAAVPAQVIRHAPNGLAIEWLELAPSLVQARLNPRGARGRST